MNTYMYLVPVAAVIALLFAAYTGSSVYPGCKKAQPSSGCRGPKPCRRKMVAG